MLLSAFEVAGPQAASPERWQNSTGSLTGIASSKQPSPLGPAALTGADVKEGALSCRTHKIHEGSGSQAIAIFFPSVRTEQGIWTKEKKNVYKYILIN